jgi:predicted amidophosphoribosyltransferase
LQSRGFNQAEILAKYLKETLDKRSGTKDKKIEIRNWLERVKDTKPQFDLTREQRLKNVKNAFVVANRYPLAANCPVCLIDDVATTGATISECAKVLKQNGAKKVFGICIARGN